MDSNKDDALKCLNIGKTALASGDRARAIKFLTKARRLDPNLPVDDLLAACNDDNNGREAAPETSSSNNNTPVANGSIKSDKSDVNHNAEARNYTDEQVEIVRLIKRNRDYYAILGVEKECSVDEVRKAYRKLSLKVHPDKNKAPGSEEAFKAVSKAFQCLSDEEMRRQYDHMGPQEDFENAQQQHVRRRRTQHGFYEDGFDPDEIFRSFFFGNPQTDFFRRAHVMRTRATAGANDGAGGRTHEGSGGFNLVNLLQILPILILFLVTYLPYSEPQYSLQKTYPYQFHKVTADYGVPFYVKSSDFDREFPPHSSQRVNIELQVIRDYKNILGRYCHMELQRRQWGRNLETPHCDRLNQFETVR
eukprot:Gb_16941 [translate_table: standard]